MSSQSTESPVSSTAVSHQEVQEEQEGQRLDNYLLSRLKGVPKSRIYRLIRKGEVRVNKKRVKPEYKLKTADLVRIPPIRIAQRAQQQAPTEALQSLISRSILYEDADLLVLNKLSGLPVHGGTGVKTGLIEALRSMQPEQKFLELAHRLDKGTSGCLLVARHPKALKLLSEQFKTGRINKTYHALVQSNWPVHVGEINAALQRQEPQGGERFVTVSKEGKKALTRFRILETFPGATLVEACPQTGRTHQIRVHAQLAGHPIIGDEKYSEPAPRKAFSKQGIKGLCLHAVELSFVHPLGGDTVTVKAPYDDDFDTALRILRQAED